VVWDFFYEHCSYFSRSSLATAFERAGFHPLGIRHVFGGQYLWLEAAVTAEAPSSRPRRDHVVGPALAYARAEGEMIADLRRRLADLPRPVAVWGAGAKGATFAQLVDPDCTRLDCIVDVNPEKQGRWLPGTGHPVVPPEALGSRGVRSVLLMNPNYRQEIQDWLRARRLPIELIDPMQRPAFPSEATLERMAR
jgi:hypothetical protein